MANKKLSKEEVSTLKDYQNKTNEIVVTLGLIELQKHALDKRKKELLEGFDTLQEDESKTASELTEKYGDGQIDLEKEEITVAE